MWRVLCYIEREIADRNPTASTEVSTVRLIRYMIVLAIGFVLGVIWQEMKYSDLNDYELEWCKEFKPELWADECRDYLDGPGQ